MSEWQPIETAPKHRPVLVYMRGTSGLGIYRAILAVWSDEVVGECWRPVGYTALDRFPLGATITHWMLPAPPVAKDGAESGAPVAPNATCKRCGRVRMLFEGFLP